MGKNSYQHLEKKMQSENESRVESVVWEKPMETQQRGILGTNALNILSSLPLVSCWSAPMAKSNWKPEGRGAWRSGPLPSLLGPEQGGEWWREALGGQVEYTQHDHPEGMQA